MHRLAIRAGEIKGHRRHFLRQRKVRPLGVRARIMSTKPLYCASVRKILVHGRRGVSGRDAIDMHAIAAELYREQRVSMLTAALLAQ